MSSKNTQKLIIPLDQLKQLGFIAEPVEEMDEGQSYQVHAIAKGDSFIEITNEINADGKIYEQYMDVRVVIDGLKSYDKELIKGLINVIQ